MNVYDHLLAQSIKFGWRNREAFLKDPEVKDFISVRPDFHWSWDGSSYDAVKLICSPIPDYRKIEFSFDGGIIEIRKYFE